MHEKKFWGNAGKNNEDFGVPKEHATKKGQLVR